MPLFGTYCCIVVINVTNGVFSNVMTLNGLYLCCLETNVITVMITFWITNNNSFCVTDQIFLDCSHTDSHTHALGEGGKGLFEDKEH